MPEIDPAGAAIRTEGLTKTFGTVTAVSELSLTVPRGEVFGLLGPNGAGKTTVVKMLLGLAHPTAGRAWLDGRPVSETAARRGVGYLPELFRYQPWLSGWEVLRFHCELAGVARAERRAEIERTLVTVGLADRAHDRTGTFSKGMQQRLGLAAALLGRPQLVFLDEPTSALDPVGRKDVRDIVRELREQGVTVLLNSHLLSEVELVCDRVAVMQRGRVAVLGRLHDLLGAPAIRIRLPDPSDEAFAAARRFGEVARSGEWLSVAGVEPEAVPDLVAALVAAGGRIQAVEQGRRTLEELFIELVEP